MSTTSLRYDDVNVGDQLPELDIPLTRTLIVSTAIASRDFQDVHHDPGLAQQRGSPDIFMNILTTNGLVGRYITDWAGPNALLKAVRIRLGAPNYPGDTMRITGAVTRKDAGEIEVGLKGSNQLGDHVIGTVVLALPDAPTGKAAKKKAKKQAKQKAKQAKKSKKKDKKKGRK